jgi:predicted N-acetyltransferase YhbS
MDDVDDIRGRAEEIAALVSTTFAASEGAAEGALLGDLVRALLRDTAEDDLRVFAVQEDGRILAAAVFTRLAYSDDARSVFLLSPMAVAPDRQGRGIGQRLLRHALTALGAAGVDVAITYGDPAFYGRVGFRPLAEGTAPPPLPLSRPEGWIGQSLTGAALTPLRGRASCAAALDDPAFW